MSPKFFLDIGLMTSCHFLMRSLEYSSRMLVSLTRPVWMAFSASNSEPTSAKPPVSPRPPLS